MEERRIRHFISGLHHTIFRSISSILFISLTKVVDAAQAVEDKDIAERGAREKIKKHCENDSMDNQQGS